MSGTDRFGSYAIDPAASLSTALQVGLIRVKPVEERSLVKIKGMKFIERLRTIKPETDENDFKSVFMELVLSETDVSAKFKIPDITQKWTEYTESALGKDPELKEAVENVRKAQDKDYVGTFRKVVSILMKHGEKVKEHLDAEEAADYLGSDLPLSYYVYDAEYTEAIGVYLRLLDKTLGRSGAFLRTSRAKSEFRVFERYFNDMKATLSRYVDIADSVFFTDRVLNTYLEVWNSETLDDLFKPKKLSIKKVDQKRFEELMERNRKALTDFKVFLLKTDVSDQFDKRLDYSEPMPAALQDMTMEFAEG